MNEVGRAVAHPEAAHVIDAPPADDEAHERENHPDIDAIELEDLGGQAQGEGFPLHRLRRIQTPRDASQNPIKKYWRRHVSISVPHEDCRDHLGEPISP